jgi:hypothetical protein
MIGDFDMFKMEISLDCSKILQEGIYNPVDIQNKIDRIMQSLNISKAGEGIFIGTGSPHDFAHFGIAITSLSEEEWFYPYLEKWLWFNSKGSNREEDFVVEDIAAYYKANHLTRL